MDLALLCPDFQSESISVRMMDRIARISSMGELECSTTIHRSWYLPSGNNAFQSTDACVCRKRVGSNSINDVLQLAPSFETLPSPNAIDSSSTLPSGDMRCTKMTAYCPAGSVGSSLIRK
jgi:hypothetical protein